MFFALVFVLAIGLLASGWVPLDGMLALPIWGVVLALLALTHLTIVSVTIYLHRHQAHRALDLHPVVSHAFRFWLWLATGTITKEWVAIHRKHHAKCETADDPHSPQVRGIKTVLWTGFELYRNEANNAATLAKFGSGTPNDWLENHLYARFSDLGIGLMLILDVCMFGVLGITVWALQMVWIPFWAAGVINGLGHFVGYRNFETRDASTNLVPWGILVGGEELHNNHHAYPSSARLSCRDWEFDIGWFYIRALELAGLARVKKVAPRHSIQGAKAMIDAETLLAVMQNRVHVMALYAQTVVTPVLQSELRRADRATRQLLRAAHPLMTREYWQADDRAHQALSAVLESSHTLALVHSYRAQLQSLWGNATLSRDQRLAALSAWCAEAESASIDVLRDFALALRGYTLQPCLVTAPRS